MDHTAPDDLLKPFSYLTSNPGKNIRDILINSFSVWLPLPPSHLTSITSIISSLHSSSLLIDDIEDSSLLRRSQPCAHLVFGIAQTINTSNYVYFIALNEVLELEKMGGGGVMEDFVNEITRLHRGQGYDILWRDTLQIPSLPSYFTMVKDKTGGLFRMAVRFMGSCSGRKEDLEELLGLCDDLAVYFQVRDDWINLAGEEYQAKKGYAEDIEEGKFSYPIVLYLNDPSTTKKDQLLNILKQRTRDVELKKYAVKILDESGFLEKAREKCILVKSQISQRITKLGGNEILEGLMSKLEEQIEKEEGKKVAKLEGYKRVEST
ncbi:hypothetical protein TrLO_g6047 [Triparma laevis f. longispina]|uniref:Uncharacterized protein n=2 Tax=Triparma laevis TaxID=1534972 RepID=A0A9W7F3H6_9STRA|nr:hypothetical protein TrLO_g6047 [Triparma laevis f. longispina]